MGHPLFRWLCLWLIFCAGGLAYADLLPPGAEDAIRRFEKNRKAFDRVDQFCTDKAPGDACMVAGSRLAGGGPGTCRSEVNRASFTIDLSCRREGVLVIQRGLPEGGFVAEADLCKGDDVSRPWNCTPLATVPVDRFCQGKALNQACTVSLDYNGAPEQQEGICRQVTEREGFYHQGRRIATRQVVLCDAPEQPAARIYRDVPWYQKLRQ